MDDDGGYGDEDASGDGGVPSLANFNLDAETA